MDDEKDKTIKSVSDPIRRRLINEQEQESSTRNGNLGVCEYEKPRKCMVHRLRIIVDIFLGWGQGIFLDE